MLNIKQIRAEPEKLDEALKARGKEACSAQVLALDAEIRKLTAAAQLLEEQKNAFAKSMASQQGRGDAASMEDLARKGKAIREELASVAEGLEAKRHQLDALLQTLPNMPAEDAVVGPDETANKEVRQWGSKPTFSFEPKEHHVLAEAWGFLDLSTAAELSGARFSILRGPLARLERAIGQFMLDTHTAESGYTEMFVPVLVNEGCMFGTGQLPKFAEDSFQTTEGHWLIPTAEVSLTNLVRGKILEEADLPIRVTALTPCFRSEAGAAGRDIKGMFRQRQFEKVELVSIVAPQQEEAEHERMTASAEKILQKLGLHYRVMELCTGDMGFSARKTYDLEVWLPGQNTYREISSCSRCGDFQARRMNARYRPKGGKPEFVCTLNGSGLAVGRTLIAVLENYQQSDGTVRIPDVLLPYMGGVKILGA